MSSQTLASQTLIGQAALKMSRLPRERLPLVIRFLDALSEGVGKAVGASSPSAPKTAVDDVLQEALERSEMLAQVPREQLMARFLELGEEIRREAIEQGTAMEQDPHDG